MQERYIPCNGYAAVLACGRRYYISATGDVRDKDGEPIPIRRNEDGEKVVFLDLWSGRKDYRVAILTALTFKPQHLPVECWNLLDVGFIDGDIDNVHPGNLVWIYPEGGIECRATPGYNYIPGFTKYVINRDGLLFSLEQSFYPKVIQSNRYKQYSIKPDLGKTTRVGRHRLMALAWIKYPASVDKLDVNHLNGVRGDDRLDNLEWATRSRNCFHAYSTGLRKENCELLVKNVVTGEVKEYYSYEDCGRDLKLEGETIRLRVKAKNQPLYPGYLLFKLKVDETPWREVVNPADELKRTGVATPILVRDIKTREVNEYASSSAASRSLGISAPTICWQLRKRSDETLRPHRGYLFKYADDERPWPEYSDDQIEVFLTNPTTLAKGVRFVDVITGEELKFANKRLAAKYFGCTDGYIYDAIRDGCLVRNRYKARWI